MRLELGHNHGPRQSRESRYSGVRKSVQAAIQVANDNRGGFPAVLIPSGSLLNVPDDSVNATGFVEVEWDGMSVQVFAVDLRDRGESIRHGAQDNE